MDQILPQDNDPLLTLRLRIVQSVIIDSGIITLALLYVWCIAACLLPGLGGLGALLLIVAVPFIAPLLYRGICYGCGSGSNVLTLGERWLGLSAQGSSLSTFDIFCCEWLVGVLSMGFSFLLFWFSRPIVYLILPRVFGSNSETFTNIYIEFGTLPIVYCLVLAFGLRLARISVFSKCGMAEKVEPIEIRARSWNNSRTFLIVSIGIFILSWFISRDAQSILQSYWGKLTLFELLFWLFWLRPTIAYSKSPVFSVLYCAIFVVPFAAFTLFGPSLGDKLESLIRPGARFIE